ncbi:MAG: hypothetical protein KAS66_14505 [Candidatus Omnitrophica bacterium]|nr:hypothetical protein [Candidatus Omnitrophota bacterium]
MSLGYSIDCGYESDKVNDHFPLEREELIKLLKIAATEKDVGIVSDIQGRVIQGIPGLTCPQKISSHTMKKSHSVSLLFLDVKPDNINSIADSIIEIYNE